MDRMIEIDPHELQAAELLLGEPACNEYWERFCLRKELSPQHLERLWFAPYIPVYYEENPDRRNLAPSMLHRMPQPRLPADLPSGIPVRYFEEPDWAQVGGDTARAYYDLKAERRPDSAYCSTIFWQIKSQGKQGTTLLRAFNELEFVRLKLSFQKPRRFPFMKGTHLTLLPCFNHMGTYVDDGRDMATVTVLNDVLHICIGEPIPFNTAKP